MRIRVIDLETTGFTPPEHEIVEVGWCDLVSTAADLAAAPHGWTVDHGGSLLVKPERPIPPESSAIHHIVDEDVAHAIRPLPSIVPRERVRPPQADRFGAHPRLEPRAEATRRLERARIRDPARGARRRRKPHRGRAAHRPPLPERRARGDQPAARLPAAGATRMTSLGAGLFSASLPSSRKEGSPVEGAPGGTGSQPTLEAAARSEITAVFIDAWERELGEAEIPHAFRWIMLRSTVYAHQPHKADSAGRAVYVQISIWQLDVHRLRKPR